MAPTTAQITCVLQSPPAGAVAVESCHALYYVILGVCECVLDTVLYIKHSAGAHIYLMPAISESVDYTRSVEINDRPPLTFDLSNWIQRAGSCPIFRRRWPDGREIHDIRFIALATSPLKAFAFLAKSLSAYNAYGSGASPSPNPGPAKINGRLERANGFRTRSVWMFLYTYRTWYRYTYIYVRYCICLSDRTTPF